VQKGFIFYYLLTQGGVWVAGPNPLRHAEPHWRKEEVGLLSPTKPRVPHPLRHAMPRQRNKNVMDVKGGPVNRQHNPKNKLWD
jgi:hypothetical protein